MRTGMMKNNPTFDSNQTPKVKGKKMRVMCGNHTALSLRKLPSDTARLAKGNYVLKGEVVTLIKEHDEDWSLIKTKDDVEAYVMSKFIQEC